MKDKTAIYEKWKRRILLAFYVAWGTGMTVMIAALVGMFRQVTGQEASPLVDNLSSIAFGAAVALLFYSEDRP